MSKWQITLQNVTIYSKLIVFKNSINDLQRNHRKISLAKAHLFRTSNEKIHNKTFHCECKFDWSVDSSSSCGFFIFVLNFSIWAYALDTWKGNKYAMLIPSLQNSTYNFNIPTNLLAFFCVKFYYCKTNERVVCSDIRTNICMKNDGVYWKLFSTSTRYLTRQQRNSRELKVYMDLITKWLKYEAA